MNTALLRGETFTTSRLAEFCSEKELTLQTGHPVEQWPLVVLKELIDNAIDACEEANIAPRIRRARLRTRPRGEIIEEFRLVRMGPEKLL